MNRTKLFVSYSRTDLEWHDRLMLHLSPLQRRSMIHVWSDTRIGAGAPWKDEIEAALSESRAAVLLITPAFLASAFIWNEEMPRILAHKKKFKMLVFPLLVKPCAWQLEPDLLDLQFRPKHGRALSVSGDGDVDTDLANLVIELATRIGQFNASVEQTTSDQGPNIAGVWSGRYGPTKRDLRMTLSQPEGLEFEGRMEYVGEDFSTAVTGQVLTSSAGSEPAAWRGLPVPGNDGKRIVFRERRRNRDRKLSVNLDGKYHAVVLGNQMTAVWVSDRDGEPKGPFELLRA